MRLIDCPEIHNRTKQVEGLTKDVQENIYGTGPYQIAITYVGGSDAAKAVALDGHIIPYIQRAVNTHEELVKALEAVLPYVPTFNPNGASLVHLIEQARSALDNADPTWRSR